MNTCPICNKPLGLTGHTVAYKLTCLNGDCLAYLVPEKTLIAITDKISAARLEGFEMCRGKAARMAYQSALKIKDSLNNTSLNAKEVITALHFIGLYRDEIRAMKMGGE